MPKYCRQCGSMLTETDVVMRACSRCGTKTTRGRIYCPECGTHRVGKDAHCNGCGFDFESLVQPKETEPTLVVKTPKSVISKRQAAFDLLSKLPSPVNSEQEAREIAERERQEWLEQARLEQARLEQARHDKERLAQEAAAREQQARVEKEKAEQEERERQRIEEEKREQERMAREAEKAFKQKDSAQRTMVFCTECGEKIPSSFRFCPVCGSRVVTKEKSVDIDHTPFLGLKGQNKDGDTQPKTCIENSVKSGFGANAVKSEEVGDSFENVVEMPEEPFDKEENDEEFFVEPVEEQEKETVFEDGADAQDDELLEFDLVMKEEEPSQEEDDYDESAASMMAKILSRGDTRNLLMRSIQKDEDAETFEEKYRRLQQEEFERQKELKESMERRRARKKKKQQAQRAKKKDSQRPVSVKAETTKRKKPKPESIVEQVLVPTETERSQPLVPIAKKKKTAAIWSAFAVLGILLTIAGFVCRFGMADIQEVVIYALLFAGAVCSLLGMKSSKLAVLSVLSILGVVVLLVMLLTVKFRLV